MPTSCPICGACNGDEVCAVDGRYTPGCPIKAELDEFEAERAAERAAEVRAGIMLPTDGAADGMYSSHGGEVITDHPFEAPKGEPWGLCAFDLHGLRCRLAESAHEYSATPYVP